MGKRGLAVKSGQQVLIGPEVNFDKCNMIRQKPIQVRGSTLAFKPRVYITGTSKTWVPVAPLMSSKTFKQSCVENQKKNYRNWWETVHDAVNSQKCVYFNV